MKATASPNFDKLSEAARLTLAASDCEYHASYDEAQRLYEEALVIYEDLLGLQSPTTAKTIRSVARMCRALGKTAEASLLEDQAQAILDHYRAGQPAEKSPFGGSSGFWELLGHRPHADGDGDGDEPASPPMGSEAQPLL